MRVEESAGDLMHMVCEQAWITGTLLIKGLEDKTMRKNGWIIVLVLIILWFIPSSHLLAQQKPEQEKRIVFHPADTPQFLLERHMGKSVTLKLDSGEELLGIVREVGINMVYLAELKGKEFYDALIRIDRISAVIVKVRSK